MAHYATRQMEFGNNYPPFKTVGELIDAYEKLQGDDRLPAAMAYIVELDKHSWLATGRRQCQTTFTRALATMFDTREEAHRELTNARICRPFSDGVVKNVPLWRLTVGDLVAAVPPFVLHCGSGIYDRAVVTSEEPLILVSRRGDMLWFNTLYPGCVKPAGRALQNDYLTAMRRYFNNYPNKEYY